LIRGRRGEYAELTAPMKRVASEQRPRTTQRCLLSHVPESSMLPEEGRMVKINALAASTPHSSHQIHIRQVSRLHLELAAIHLVARKKPVSASTFEILQKYRTIAVVGISRSPEKDAYKIPRYMKSQGYTIVPVNPFADEILGEKCYRSLSEMPEEILRRVEVVDIFRPSEEALDVVRQAVEMKRRVGRPFVVWMQRGIVNEEAAEIARNEGMEVVMDRCLLVEHRRMKRQA